MTNPDHDVHAAAAAYRHQMSQHHPDPGNPVVHTIRTHARAVNLTTTTHPRALQLTTVQGEPVYYVALDDDGGYAHGSGRGRIHPGLADLLADLARRRRN